MKTISTGFLIIFLMFVLAVARIAGCQISWCWVFAPLWVPIAAAGALLVVALAAVIVFLALMLPIIWGLDRLT